MIGSQAILGSFDEDDLPEPAHASIEADVFFANDPDLAKTNSVDGHLGEDSQFHETFGYYAQECDVTTATLPTGWQDRLVRFTPPAVQGASGLCLERHDLALSKLLAHREKIPSSSPHCWTAGLLQIGVLRSRAELLPVIPMRIRRVVDWLDAYTANGASR